MSHSDLSWINKNKHMGWSDAALIWLFDLWPARWDAHIDFLIQVSPQDVILLDLSWRSDHTERNIIVFQLR